ncbi:MAG: hypothetical protein K8R28_04485 [Desulfobacterales bacterium]|nr:hypothetical protein [Desulfobacterales bacterium]
MSDSLLDLHQSLAHQGLAKSLDISIGMPALFANLAASRSWHISSQKIAQLRLKNSRLSQFLLDFLFVPCKWFVISNNYKKL